MANFYFSSFDILFISNIHSLKNYKNIDQILIGENVNHFLLILLYKNTNKLALVLQHVSKSGSN